MNMSLNVRVCKARRIFALVCALIPVLFWFLMRVMVLRRILVCVVVRRMITLMRLAFARPVVISTLLALLRWNW